MLGRHRGIVVVEPRPQIERQAFDLPLVLAVKAGLCPQPLVNFERGRVRPNFSLNFSVGAKAWERGERSATLQFDVRNVTDRLNVINFTGVFSGTALAAGREFSAQLKLRF